MANSNTVKKSAKQYLLQAVLFIALVAAADFITGKILKYFYNRQSSGWEYSTRYSAEETKADVLVFGASRAQQQYNTQIMQDSLQLACYNVGRDGMPFFYHYAMLQAVLKRYSPKIIVLDCEYAALLKSESSYDRITSLLPLYKDHPEIQSIINLRSPFEKYKYISGVYPYNSMMFKIAIANLESNKKEKEDILGYVPLHGSLSVPIKTYDFTNKYELDSVKINMLKMFIDDCLKRNIRLYFVASPYYMKTIGVDYSLDTTQIIAAEKNIPFIDYSKDSSYYSMPQLFDDTVHLNAKGAKIFSASIAAVLKKSMGE
jgi:hypothetical protein